MDKLRELLGKAGVSEELIDGICEEFEHLSASIKEQHNKELAERIQRAKQVCLEEVAREKASLARKVKVFLESKARSFDEAAARQRRIDESESATKVRRAVDILTDGDGSNVVGEDVGRVAADRKLISRLEKALTSVREERDNALLRSKRAFGIAESALKRNQLLTDKLREAGVVDEGKKELPEFLKKKGEKKDDAPKGGTDDSPEKPESECMEDTQKPVEKVRLSESRTAKAKSRVAAPVLKESQERTAAKTESKVNKNPEISRIADMIPDRE